MESLGQQSGDRQRGRDGELPHGQWNQRRNQAPESHQQQDQRCGNHEALAASHVIGARLANVEVQRDLAGQFQLRARVPHPQLTGKCIDSLVERGHQRLDRPPGGGEPHHDKRSTSVAQKDRIGQLEVGDHPGHARLVSQSRLNRGECFSALFRIRGWQSLDHHDHAVNKWRMKAADQLLPDSLRLAAFDACCRLQVALRMKREREQRHHYGKDDPGGPEAARKHDPYDVISETRVTTAPLEPSAHQPDDGAQKAVAVVGASVRASSRIAGDVSCSRAAIEIIPLRCMNFKMPLTVSSSDGSGMPHAEASRAF